MSPRRPTDGIDAIIGFIGAFAALFLVVTVVCEITGRPALTWALILLGLVVLLALAVRRRTRILRGIADRGGEMRSRS
jgi:Flp pilus assembly protein TadB